MYGWDQKPETGILPGDSPGSCCETVVPFIGSSAAAERDLSGLGSPVQDHLSLGFESSGLTQVFQVNAVLILHGVSQPPTIRTIRVHQ